MTQGIGVAARPVSHLRGPYTGPVGEYNAGARAKLALATALREDSDYARGLVADVGVKHLPGELIRNVRRLRLLGLSALDRAVLVEVLTGTSWEDVAEALVMPVGEVRRRYEETVELWRKALPTGELDATIYGDLTTGLRHDHDPEGTAEALDGWYNRHCDPWQSEDTPVQRALTGP